MGSRSFLEKLQDQLSGEPDELIALAAELLFIQVVPLGNLKASTKLNRIESVLSWASEPLPLPEAMRAGLEAGGTFHGGAGFNIRIWQQLLWLTRFVETWWEAPENDRQVALKDPWAFRDLAMQVPDDEAAMRTSLQGLAWPGYFDDTVTADHRVRIRDAFAHELQEGETDDPGDVDKDLWRIRQRVQVLGAPRFSWYEEPYKSQWMDETPSKGRRAWLFRPGPGGDELLELWRDEGFVSRPADNLELGFHASNEREVQTAVAAGYSHLDYAQRLQLSQALQTFLLRIAPEDFVLVAAGDRVHLGVVSGEPEWVDTFGSRLRRGVDWLADSPERSTLPEPLLTRIAKQGDIVDVTAALDSVTALADLMTDNETQSPDGSLPEHVVTAAGAGLPEISEELAASVHIPRETLQEYLEVLEERQQLVFYGPPGTGKTFIASALASHIVGDDTDHVRTVQFHPSYSYEDFFEGLRPVVNSGNVTYELLPGPLRRLVAEATTPGNEAKPYVLIIDEMNRANLAKVFGELYFLLEYRDQSISLQYSPDSDFSLPKNLYIIGTMNTLDRSISVVDAAIRRRFPFVELHPAVEPVSKVLRSHLRSIGEDEALADLLDTVNDNIEERELQIGPSYLMKASAHTQVGLERIWRYDILPLLDDHFHGVLTPETVREQFGLHTLRRTPSATGGVDIAVGSGVEIELIETDVVLGQE